METECLDQSHLIKIIEQLWGSDKSGSSRKVYALLDGARDEQIYPLVNAAPYQSACLYREPITDSLRTAAPYLLEMGSPQSFYTKQLLQLAWGNSWGIFMIVDSITTNITALQQHCRKLTLIKSPTGESMLFRYYDPRVLRVYLPTCNDEELKQLFGPIKEIMMEGDHQGQEKVPQLLRYPHPESGDRLTRHSI